MGVFLCLDILVILSRRWDQWNKAKGVSDKEAAGVHVTWVRGCLVTFVICTVVLFFSLLGCSYGEALFLSYSVKFRVMK